MLCGQDDYCFNAMVGFATSEASDFNFHTLFSCTEGRAVCVRLFPVGTGWPQILKAAGVFDSTSQARRCGWDRPLKLYETVRVGKGLRRRIVTVMRKLNEKEEEQWGGS